MGRPAQQVDEVSAAIERYIAAQFPKKCACGVVYTAVAWSQLDLVGPMGDSVASLELRNCVCGSTIAIVTKILDAYRFTIRTRGL